MFWIFGKYGNGTSFCFGFHQTENQLGKCFPPFKKNREVLMVINYCFDAAVVRRLFSVCSKQWWIWFVKPTHLTYLLQVHVNSGVFAVETIILITMLKFKKVPIQNFPGNLQMCKKNFLAIQRCHIKHIWIIYMTFKTRRFQIQLDVQPLSVSDFEKPCKPMHLVALGW